MSFLLVSFFLLVYICILSALLLNTINMGLTKRETRLQGVSGAGTTLAAPAAAVARSSFPALASGLARDIAATSGKLERLTRLARKTGVFDSAAQELDELTHVVKQDIQQLKQRIDQLAPLHMRRNKQAEQYSDGVLKALQMQLAGTTCRFQDILTQRTSAIHHQHDTRKLFTGQLSDGAALLVASPQANAAAMEKRGHALVADPNDENAPLLMVAAQDQVFEHRAVAAQQIESTIVELHQIFQQLNNIVAQQRDLTIRIDANIDETLVNAESAQTQIIKYWRNVSSNRWFLLKIFAVLAVFVTLFLVFFV